MRSTRRACPRWRGQPVGEARGIAVHESQSLLMEMQACRSPRLRRLSRRRAAPRPSATIRRSPPTTSSASTSGSSAASSGSMPTRSPIRCTSSCATGWSAPLIAGDLAVRRPARRLERGHARAAGRHPARRSRWAACRTSTGRSARFGYFPCYTLGAHAGGPAVPGRPEQIPGLLDAIGTGDFAPLLAWLRERVHGRGCLPRFGELVEHATGGSLRSSRSWSTLRERYLGESA